MEEEKEEVKVTSNQVDKSSSVFVIMSLCLNTIILINNCF